MESFKTFVRWINLALNTTMPRIPFTDITPTLPLRGYLIVSSIVKLDIGWYVFDCNMTKVPFARIPQYLLLACEKPKVNKDRSLSSLLTWSSIHIFCKATLTIQAKRSHHHFFVRIPILYLATF